MKENLTELVFILDRSGSMAGLASDTIGGFNSMIEEQKKEPGDAYVTTVLFDHEYKMIHDHVDLKKVAPITDKEYYPRGSTALLDAVGRTINDLGDRLNNTPEEERPSKVIFVITTDGYENASREFSKAKVKEMIEHQQSKYSWVFVFLGATMDAVGESAGLGINTDFARTYTANEYGTESIYAAMSSSLSLARDASFNVNTRNDTYVKTMSSLDGVK